MSIETITLIASVLALVGTSANIIYGWFEIRNLPAGEEIEFQVWHEGGVGLHGELVARPEWAKGRLRVTIPRDDVLDLGAIELAPAAFRPAGRVDVSRTLPGSSPR